MNVHYFTNSVFLDEGIIFERSDHSYCFYQDLFKQTVLLRSIKDECTLVIAQKLIAVHFL